VFTLIVFTPPAFAQTGIKADLARHWKTSGDFTLAVAKTMPAESYNFRPNPDEMNFGQVMAHIAIANLSACSRASGMPRPELRSPRGAKTPIRSMSIATPPSSSSAIRSASARRP
jgi:hypothetical protein